MIQKYCQRVFCRVRQTEQNKMSLYFFLIWFLGFSFSQLPSHHAAYTRPHLVFTVVYQHANDLAEKTLL